MTHTISILRSQRISPYSLLSNLQSGSYLYRPRSPFPLQKQQCPPYVSGGLILPEAATKRITAFMPRSRCSGRGCQRSRGWGRLARPQIWKSPCLEAKARSLPFSVQRSARGRVESSAWPRFSYYDYNCKHYIEHIE